MGFFVFLFGFLFAQPLYAQDTCLMVKQESFALRGKKGQRTKKRIYKGEKLPFLGINSDGSVTKTKIAGKIYWVKTSFVEKMAGDLCLSFNENNRDGVTNQDVNEEVRTGQNSDSKQSASKDEKASQDTWKFGIEAGYLLSVSSKPLNNLVTATPDPTVDVNDDAFDSPFIDSVDGESGIDFSVFADLPLTEMFRLKVMLGYMQKNLSYVSRLNPANQDQSFVTYNQLAQQTNQIQFRSAHLTLMPKVRFMLSSIPVNFGIGLRGQYYLDALQVEFRTAPLKLTSYFVRSGYAEFELEILPRLEVHFAPIYLYVQGTNRLSGSDFSMDPQVGVGLEF